MDTGQKSQLPIDTLQDDPAWQTLSPDQYISAHGQSLYHILDEDTQDLPSL